VVSHALFQARLNSAESSTLYLTSIDPFTPLHPVSSKVIRLPQLAPLHSVG